MLDNVSQLPPAAAGTSDAAIPTLPQFQTNIVSKRLILPNASPDSNHDHDDDDDDILDTISTASEKLIMPILQVAQSQPTDRIPNITTTRHHKPNDLQTTKHEIPFVPDLYSDEITPLPSFGDDNHHSKDNNDEGNIPIHKLPGIKLTPPQRPPPPPLPKRLSPPPKPSPPPQDRKPKYASSKNTAIDVTSTTEDENSSPERQQQNNTPTKIRNITQIPSMTEEEAAAAGVIRHKRKDLATASDASSSLASSIRFSDLKLMEVIGGGGFGQVWHAIWRGTPVAVKMLTNGNTTTTTTQPPDEEGVPHSVLAEFAAEINLLSGMRHPNICLYIGACLDPPNRAIITELAAHGSLWDALRKPLALPFVTADGVSHDSWPLRLYDMDDDHQNRHDGGDDDKDGGGELLDNVPALPPLGTWPWSLVKKVASGAVRGMTYLHSGTPPVLHRDLKSANLLLDESYTTKVADFGLSRIKAHRKSSSMTGNCGTVQWMAPEVLANESYAEPADVYSFGIILWELLTRECPYEGMSPIQCALAVLNKGDRPKIPSWCPPALVALIDTCTAQNPESRPTFAQVLSALDAMP